MWRVSVTGDCGGSAMCTVIAPGHFELNDRNRAQPIGAEIEPDDAVVDAAVACPLEAILVVDAATGAPVEL